MKAINRITALSLLAATLPCLSRAQSSDGIKVRADQAVNELDRAAREGSGVDEESPVPQKPRMAPRKIQTTSKLVKADYDLKILKGEIDTGFRPGRDDWQFPNHGTSLQYGNEGPGFGMLLTEFWYYISKPDGEDVHLHDRTNNNGGEKTAIWEDDSLALRLTSTLANDLDQEDAVVTPLVVSAKKTPREVWREVAKAMLKSGEPQFLRALEVSTDESKINAAKHLMVYRIVDQKLYVADPIFPGRERMPVELTPDGKFQPYVSKSRGDVETAAQYNTMILESVGPRTRAILAKRWQEFKAGGAQPGPFMPYEFQTVDASGGKSVLRDGDAFAAPAVTILAHNKNLALGLRVYRDGTWLNEDTDEPVTIKLRPGKNVIGLKVSQPGQGKWFWHDFKYLTLISTLCDLKVSPAQRYCPVGTPCSFTTETAMGPEGLAVDWYVDEKLYASDGAKALDIPFSEEGPHYVKAVLRAKNNDRVICDAQALANIQPKVSAAASESAPPKPKEPSMAPVVPPEGGFNQKFFALLRQCNVIWAETGFNGKVAGDTDGKAISTFPQDYHLGSSWDGSHVPGNQIEWQGSAFTRTYTKREPARTIESRVRGTISLDGSTIKELVATYKETLAGTDQEYHETQTWRVEARNVRMAAWNADDPKKISAKYEAESPAQANLVKIEYEELHYRNGRISGHRKLLNPDWTQPSWIEIHFGVSQ